MTALQRISASVKRKISQSLSQSEAIEDEVHQALEEAKGFLATKDAPESRELSAEDAKLLRSLCELLESSLASGGGSAADKTDRRLDHPQRFASQGGSYETWAAGAQSQRQRRMLMSKLESALEMGTIHEEEHHDQNSISNKEDSTTSDEAEMPTANENVCPEGDSPDDPFLVTFLPLFLLVLTVIAWLFIGAAIYRWIDPEIAAKSFPRTFIWSFQLLSTIGWGDTRASTTLGQAFTVFYILVGIPMLFSAFANFGRLLTEFCCLEWPKMLIWLRKKGISGKSKESVQLDEVQRMPSFLIAALFSLHMCIGLALYCVWLKEWGPVATVYYRPAGNQRLPMSAFSITTMATSGFGDYHPDTDSWMETIVGVLYLSVGITLLSALFLTISFHYQAFHHVYLKEAASKLYYEKWKPNQTEKTNRICPAKK